MNSWQLRAAAEAVLAVQRGLFATGCRLLALSWQKEVTEAEALEAAVLLADAKKWLGESVQEVG